MRQGDRCGVRPIAWIVAVSATVHTVACRSGIKTKDWYSKTTLGSIQIKVLVPGIHPNQEDGTEQGIHKPLLASAARQQMDPTELSRTFSGRNGVA